MNRNLWYAVIGVIVLIGLFYLLKPKSIPPTAPANSMPESTSSSQTATSAKIFDLIIKNKKLTAGPDTLKVTEGDEVTINITSDEAEEFHLHGYDKSVELEASKEAQLTFSANLTGRFPFELEKSKTELGALEVSPKQ